MHSFLDDLSPHDKETLRGNTDLTAKYGRDYTKWPHDVVRLALCEAHAFPWIDVNETLVDYDLYKSMHKLCREIGFLPCFKGRISLHVFMPEPFLAPRMRALRNHFHREIHPIGTSEKAFDRTIAWLETRLASEPVEVLKERPPPPDITSWNYKPGEGVEFVERVLKVAYLYRTSDIFFETYPDRMDIRFKAGGSCAVMPPVDEKYSNMVMQDAKAFASMGPREERGYRDGSAQLAMPDGNKVNFRAVAQKSLHGETMTFRLLDQSSVINAGKTLPFPERESAIVRGLINRKQGIILVCGPTGSGKTTTLWRMLRHLDSSAKKIVTIEDPVEYYFDRFIQLPVKGTTEGADNKDDHPETFGLALRSCLRAAPDVVLVGEIRDGETARVAIEAALTGHLILSTLHTSDSVATITRLVDKGVTVQNIAQTLLAVIFQRLAPRLCSCHIPIPITEDQAKHWRFHFKDEPPPENFYIENGCPKCGKSGRAGMIPVFELFVPDAEILDVISTKCHVPTIQKMWQERGGVPLGKYALKLARDGHVSYEEAQKIEYMYRPGLNDLEAGEEAPPAS